MLQRRLRDAGHETKCVRNVTDVDDDILRKARELGVHYLDLAAEEMARFDAEMGLLNLLPVYSEPRATSAIAEILSLIGDRARGRSRLRVRGLGLLQRGHLPRVRAQLSGFGPGRDAGAGRRARGPPGGPEQARPARLRAVAAVAARRAGLGVALGAGTAGVAHRVLGPRAAGARRDDRHPRGRARSRLPAPRVRDGPVRVGDRASRFVRLWFHVGLVGFEGTKMSKSLGNLVFVGDLCKEWDPAAVRLALLAHHYREDWDWRTGEDMPAAAARLALWSQCARLATAPAGLAAVRAALDDDLDTPGALRCSTRRRRRAGRWPTGRGCWASTSSGTNLAAVRGPSRIRDRGHGQAESDEGGLR